MQRGSPTARCPGWGVQPGVLPATSCFYPPTAPKDEERGQGGIPSTPSAAPTMGTSPAPAGLHPPALRPSWSLILIKEGNLPSLSWVIHPAGHTRAASLGGNCITVSGVLKSEGEAAVQTSQGFNTRLNASTGACLFESFQPAFCQVI